MTDNEKTIPIKGELPESLFNALVELAKKRGVSANTVLQQALETETYLAGKERDGAKVLIEEADKTVKRVVRKK
jgi:hypothetical protein